MRSDNLLFALGVVKYLKAGFHFFYFFFQYLIANR